VLFVENMSRTQGIKITGSGSCFNTGLSVGRAVDFNGDGFKDIVFSALSRTTSQGIVFILFNDENHWDNDISVDDLNNNPKNRTNAVFKIIFPAFSFAGLSLASIGDINSDGFQDIAIGSLPYKGGYQSQRSYLIYGRRGRERGGRRRAGDEEGSGDGRNETMELSEMREGIDGITIIGGGFLVAGPGDLNGDGIADLFIVSYPHWQGESNSYLIHYPDDRMSSPPSPFPSSSPSSLPSSAPSSSPTLLVTTETPSNLPTISTPSPTIDLSQPFLSFSPTTTSKPTPSPTQTLPPKSIRPTRIPTVRATRSPSTSVPTSEASSFKRVTGSPTTMKPSLTPSFCPTTPPSSVPSVEPTFVKEDLKMITSYETVYCDNSSAACEAVTDSNTQFIIQSEGNIHIHCDQQLFHCIYLILPMENSKMFIEDLDLRKDVLDFSRFPLIHRLEDLSISTNPLAIHLSTTQQIVFPSFTNFAFTEEDFLFHSEVEKPQPNNYRENVVQIASLALMVIFFCVCIFFGGIGLGDKDNEKDKLKEDNSENKNVSDIENVNIVPLRQEIGDDIKQSTNINNDKNHPGIIEYDSSSSSWTFSSNSSDLGPIGTINEENEEQVAKECSNDDEEDQYFPSLEYESDGSSLSNLSDMFHSNSSNSSTTISDEDDEREKKEDNEADNS
jgi:hypothetical protein